MRGGGGGEWRSRKKGAAPAFLLLSFCRIGEHLIQLRKGGVLGHLLEHADGVGEVLRLQVDRLLQLSKSVAGHGARLQQKKGERQCCALFHSVEDKTRRSRRKKFRIVLSWIELKKRQIFYGQVKICEPVKKWMYWSLIWLSLKAFQFVSS